MPGPYRVPMIPLETARWRLATVWFGGAGLIATILAVQSLFNVYGEKIPQVWGWALPNIVPTLSLMLGVCAGAAVSEESESDSMRVRLPFFWLSLGLSCFHLLCVAAVILAGPMLPSRTPEQEFDPLHAFVLSNLWLGPLQGLVAAAVGALFFSKTANGKKDAADSRSN
jgi:hypothetical protein